MVKREPNERFVRSEDNKLMTVVSLVCDTAAELEDLTELDGVTFAFGSIAHAVDDAVILRLDSSGDWVVQTGDNAGKTVSQLYSAGDDTSPANGVSALGK